MLNQEGINPVSKERLTYIDAAKGIGILAVIAGHMGNSFVNKFIFSFHMPIFFVIIGYFLPIKLDSAIVLRKRVRQLVPPYIFSCLCIILFNQLKTILGIILSRKTVHDLLSISLEWTYASMYGAGTAHESPISIPAIGAIWFLLATAFGSYITKKALERKYSSIIIVLIVIAGILSSKIFWLPFSIQCGMAASGFIYLGVLLSDNGFLNKPVTTQIQYIAPAFAIWLHEIFFTNSWMDIAQNRYPNGAFDFVGGGCASICVLWIVKILYQKSGSRKIWSLLEWFGKNSLTILCFHLIELKIVPWTKILHVLGINNYLFLATLLLKIMWCVVWVAIAEHTALKRIFYPKKKLPVGGEK